MIDDMKSRGLQFLEGMRPSFPASQAAIFAEARSLLDWNARNPFCAQCGQPTLSINAGFKRTCPPKDMASLSEGSTIGSTSSETPTERPACASRKGISNISFPRFVSWSGHDHKLTTTQDRCCNYCGCCFSRWPTSPGWSTEALAPLLVLYARRLPRTR